MRRILTVTVMTWNYCAPQSCYVITVLLLGPFPFIMPFLWVLDYKSCWDIFFLTNWVYRQSYYNPVLSCNMLFNWQRLTKSLLHSVACLESFERGRHFYPRFCGNGNLFRLSSARIMGWIVLRFCCWWNEWAALCVLRPTLPLHTALWWEKERGHCTNRARSLFLYHLSLSQCLSS